MHHSQEINTLRDQILMDPYNDLLLTRYGTFLCAFPYYPEEALYYLRRAMNINPKNHETYFWAAICIYHNYCDEKQARDWLYKAVSISPENPESLSFLAVLVEDKATALDLMYRAVRCAPDWPILRDYLANELIYRGEYDLAAREVQGLLRLIEQEEYEVIVPRDPVAEYFEMCMTGRARTYAHWKELAEGLVERLNNLKK